MLDKNIISQLDFLSAQFEEGGNIKASSKLDEITQILAVANTDLSDHVNTLTDMLCGYLKIDPEEAISISADLVEKYGLKEEDLLNMGDSEVDGFSDIPSDFGFITNMFPTGAFPQVEKRQGPDPKLVNLENPNWWEPKVGNFEEAIKVIGNLEKYSSKLKQAGYKEQAKKIGLMISKLMLDLDYKVDNSVKSTNIRKGMFLRDIEKNVVGEVKDVDVDNNTVKISLLDTRTGNTGGIVLSKYDNVMVVKRSKPLQREALVKKASLLLEDLSADLVGNALSLQLERLRYELEN